MTSTTPDTTMSTRLPPCCCDQTAPFLLLTLAFSLYFTQINAKTDLALRYNDISPLENHHCAVAFGILSKVKTTMTWSWVKNQPRKRGVMSIIIERNKKKKKEEQKWSKTGSLWDTTN